MQSHQLLLWGVPMVVCPLIGFLMVSYNPLLLLAGVVALALLGLILWKPDVGTVVVVFILYANLAAVAYQFHGVPKPIAAMVTLILAAPLVTYVGIRREKFIADKIFWLNVLFFIVLLISGVFSQDLPLALERIVDLFLQGLILYILIINVIRTFPTLRKVIWAVLLAGAFMGGLTLFQEVTGTQSNDYGGLAQTGGLFTEGRNLDGKMKRGRAAGPVGEKNRYAQILLVLVPLGMFRFWQEKSMKMKAVALGSVALIICGLLLTFSRGAFVTLVFIFLIMTVLRYLKIRQVLVAALLFVILMSVVAPAYMVRMSTLVGIQGFFSKTASTRPGEVIRHRTAENIAALRVFLEHPLLGVGPGHYRKYYSLEYINQVGMGREVKGMKAHNMYLEAAAESGLFGLFALLAVVFYTLRQLWRTRRRCLPDHPDFAGLATSMILAILAFMGTSVFLHLSYPRYFWLLLGLASATMRCIEREIDTPVEAVKPLAEDTPKSSRVEMVYG